MKHNSPKTTHRKMYNMGRSFERFIASRYLRTRKKTGIISLNTFISIAGVTVGVAALIIVLSLMNGFTSEIRNRYINMNAHLWIYKSPDQNFYRYAHTKSGNGKVIF